MFADFCNGQRLFRIYLMQRRKEKTFPLCAFAVIITINADFLQSALICAIFDPLANLGVVHMKVVWLGVGVGAGRGEDPLHKNVITISDANYPQIFIMVTHI